MEGVGVPPNCMINYKGKYKIIDEKPTKFVS